MMEIEYLPTMEIYFAIIVDWLNDAFANFRNIFKDFSVSPLVFALKSNSFYFCLSSFLYFIS